MFVAAVFLAAVSALLLVAVSALLNIFLIRNHLLQYLIENESIHYTIMLEFDLF